MSKTGPQRYPGASVSEWFQDKFGGDKMEVNVICLHTTEGTSLPDYNGGSIAPNLTAVPDFRNKRLRWYQHFDIETSSRALQNLRGGVETNTLNVSQVELVGTCDPATHKRWLRAGVAHIYWSEAPDWALHDLAEFLAWMHTNHGVPLTGPAKWPTYPTSYANEGGQRLTFDQWNDFKGVCGHMHVPENTHGDPGSIKFPQIISLAKIIAGTSETPKRYEPFPGEAWFKKKPNSRVITAMGKRLIELGYKGYKVGPGSQWTEADRQAYAWWQRKLGYSGADADGWPGKDSWDKLKVPNV
jgi:hypothetical protein